MMDFEDFRCARIILSGIETIHMIRKGQMKADGVARTAAEQFYSLVMKESIPRHNFLPLPTLSRHNHQ